MMRRVVVRRQGRASRAADRAVQPGKTTCDGLLWSQHATDLALPSRAKSISRVTLADLRTAWRHLRRQRGSTWVAALSLALGMSLATAVFSMVDALFLRPLPLPGQERLARLYLFNPQAQRESDQIAGRHVMALQGGVRSLQAVGTAMINYEGVILGESGSASRVSSASITGGFFDVLGVRPIIGRGLEESDALAGVTRVVIAHSVWQARFGGAADILQRTILIDGVTAQVMGVMPPGFDYPRETAVWLPLSLSSIRAIAGAGKHGDDWPRFFSLARLAPGATKELANAELSLMYGRVDREAGVENPRQSRLVSLAADANALYRQQMSLWIAAAIVVALLCAVNFATLSLARGMRRKAELAVRLAVGASPRRIVALLITEAAVIAAVAGVIATVLGAWLLAARHLWFTRGALPVEPELGWPTIAFGIVATVVVGFVFALGPAVELARADLRPLLSGGSTTTSGGRELRGRRGLVALQLGLSLAALAVVVALVVAVRQQELRGPGYDYTGVVTASVFLPAGRSGESLEPPLLDFVRGIPGVQRAAIVRSPDVGATGFTPDTHPQERAHMQWLDVSDGYFGTTGVRPIAGRLPTAGEVAQRAPVIVLSQTTAKWTFGFSDIDPIGRRLGVTARGERTPTWYTVIGIVPDIRFGPQFRPLSVPVYTLQSLPLASSNARVIIRFAGDARRHVAAMQTALAGFDAGVVVTDVRAVASEVDAWMERSRGRATFFLIVAVLAVVLAIVGVYGLTSYSAELRAREIGIRMALGAPSARLVSLMLSDLGWVILPAAAGGILLGSRVVGMIDSAIREPLLQLPVLSFHVVPVVIASLGLVAVVSAGMMIPTRRVLRSDIVRALQ